MAWLSCSPAASGEAGAAPAGLRLSLFTPRCILPAGVGLQVLQQLCGINTVGRAWGLAGEMVGRKMAGRTDGCAALGMQQGTWKQHWLVGRPGTSHVLEGSSEGSARTRVRFMQHGNVMKPLDRRKAEIGVAVSLKRAMECHGMPWRLPARNPAGCRRRCCTHKMPQRTHSPAPVVHR
jgi:hypothetical protein